MTVRALLLFVPLAVAGAAEYPSAVLDNGAVRLDLYLPDATSGYYRGSRFDWSGMIGQITAGGVTYCRPWRTPHDPEHTENAIGPAGEFGMHEPPGYAEATVGGQYLKIGVGALVKYDDQPFRFNHPGAVAERGTWTVTPSPTAIAFTHELSAAGYAYRYTKTVALATSGPSFTISYRFENTGTKPIVTDHYCHHFTSIAGADVDGTYRIVPPEPPAGEVPKGLAWNDGVLAVVAPPAAGAPLWGVLAQALPADANRFTIASSRGAMAVTGDFPTLKWELYSMPQALCVEPFMAIDVAPGAEQRWSSTYTLSATP
jgi:hypothetical protein